MELTATSQLPHPPTFSSLLPPLQQPPAGPLEKGLCSYSSFPYLFGSGAHIISLHTLDLQGGWGVEITVAPGKLGSPLIPLVKGMWGHIRRAAQSKARGSTQGQRAGELLPPAGPTVGERMGGVGEEVTPCPSVPPSADMGTLCSGFLLKEDSSGTSGPLRLQRSDGMQIGIRSHKNALCMDFLLDFTWKLIIHHPAGPAVPRTCVSSFSSSGV